MITVQALQADGTWAVRNAFVTENKMLDRGIIKAAELDTKARAVMARWQAASQDGKQLRVHNSANDPTPVQRKRSDANAKAETEARALGWVTNQEMHGECVESYGVVHPAGHWAADWRSAVVFHEAMSAHRAA